MTEKEAIRSAFRDSFMELRVSSKLSQETCAERCDLSRQYVSIIETLGRIPKLDTFVKIADGMGVSPEDFLHSILKRAKECRADEGRAGGKMAADSKKAGWKAERGKRRT